MIACKIRRILQRTSHHRTLGRYYAKTDRKALPSVASIKLHVFSEKKGKHKQNKRCTFLYYKIHIFYIKDSHLF